MMLRFSIISIILFQFSLLAKADDEAGLSWGGDFRVGYYTLHRDDRDGSSDVTDEFRTRIRVGVTQQLGEHLQGKVRFAGRYSTIQGNHFFSINDHVPSTDGLRRGDSTLDQIYVDYSPDNHWRFKAGRLQTKFELQGVARKSLDRNDSPNVDITWTDGVQISYQSQSSWLSHLILQHNASDGPTNVMRSPLNFSESDSRWTYFVALENNQSWGPVIQRGVDLTYIPQALRVDGTATGKIDDYIGLVGRIAANWPAGQNGMKFLVGAEVGNAFNTPARATVGTGLGDTGGLAWQLSGNFVEIKPGHSFGLVIGQVQDGWLISPDFRNNNSLIEGRYQWKINKTQKLEARLRQRDDLDRIISGVENRVDQDFYLRYTHKI